MIKYNIDLLCLVHVFSFEISLEKYRKIINNPLIIIRINISGNSDLDFESDILIDKIML